MKYFFTLLLSFFAIVFTANSQTFKKSQLVKPNAILFMLNKSTNKIEAMKKRGMQSEIHLVEEADNEINRSIIEDFNANFSFVPVYYFYSDQYDLVKRKDWKNVVFYDFEHLTSPKKIEVNSFGNYLIVEVNYPPVPVYEEIAKDSKVSALDDDVAPKNDYVNSNDYGLLVYDEDFNNVDGELQFTNISLFRKGNILKSKEIKYTFKGSRRFQNILINYKW